MKIKFEDTGTTITVSSVYELVSWMNETSFTPAKNNAAYMLAYAKRSVIVADEDIRATSEQEFFDDLLKYRHIKILDQPSVN